MPCEGRDKKPFNKKYRILKPLKIRVIRVIRVMTWVWPGPAPLVCQKSRAETLATREGGGGVKVLL